MTFSKKQVQALTWWCDDSPHKDKEAVICDGAVRSGKTFCLGLGFFLWAMERFQDKQFALCGKTVASVRRNLLHGLVPVLKKQGYQIEDKVSRNQLTVSFGGRENTFYLFGGRDESSAGLIQGVTLAGAFLDEVALMPRSFVEQTVARCSVAGAKVWFACNPESPEHWFYKEWVCRTEERKALRLHFAMADNPSLPPDVLERYQRTFQGAFYRRFVLGEWTVAEGRVYDFFDEGMVQRVPRGEFDEWRVSVDYGTVNPTSMGLWGRLDGVWYRVDEFYYDSRREGGQKTDLEYLRDLEGLTAGKRIRQVVVDPSAASFITLLRRKGWPVEAADNDVLSGIRTTASLLREGKLVICDSCPDAIREFSLYCWDENAKGDRVVKRFDHAMDEIRYFAVSLGGSGGYIGAMSVERTSWN